MKRFLLIIFLGVAWSAMAQQDAERAAVMQPIVRLFMGMNQGDSSRVHSAFANDVTMATVMKDKTGTLVVRRESSIAAFLKAVGSPHSEPWSEPIWDTRIEVDGNFAQVWTQYAFYVGKKFSHCGVDAFHLVNDGKEWKIIHLADTRHTTGCNVPSSVSDQFK